MPDAEDKRRQARELLLKARIYRFFAACFALVGMVIFIVLYLQHIEGDLWAALSSPFSIVIILVPFLPAAVLAWLSNRAEAALFKIVHDEKMDADK